jgi:uncharacterized protein YdhG (YjbR/CyaY superfamily)
MKPSREPATSIDTYIAEFPSEIRERLESIRDAIRRAAPDAEEKISYQIPTFSLFGNLVHFAAFKGHIGFYPGPAGIEKFKGELSSYEISKGTVRFPMDKPIPLDIVEKVVRFRVAENLAAKKAKKTR